MYVCMYVYNCYIRKLSFFTDDTDDDDSLDDDDDAENDINNDNYDGHDDYVEDYDREMI